MDISQSVTQILGQHENKVNQLSQLSGTDLLISASDDSTLCAWNLTTNALLSTFRGNERVKSFAWIQNSSNIIIIESNIKLYKWNYKTSDKVLITQYIEDGEMYYTFASHSLNFEKKVLIGSSNRLLKFNLTTMAFEEDSMELINCLAIAELNNNQIATGNFSEQIFIWNTETNELVTSFNAHYQGVLQLIYEQSNNYLISSSYDSRVKIFECTQYQLVHNFKTHINPVESLILQTTHKQKILYSSGWDQQIIAWDIETGEELKKFTNFPSHKILLLENSDRMVAANMDGVIEIFSKSYSCSLNTTSTSLEFTQCICSGIGKSEVQSLVGANLCAVVLEETPVFNEIASPHKFQLVFQFDQQQLINQLINEPQTYTQLTIGNLVYGTDFTYNLEKEADNKLIIEINYLNEIILENDTKIILKLLVDDYIQNNKYILLQKEFNYTTTNSQKSCKKDSYYDEISQTCKDIFTLEPIISLTSEANVLKLKFLNDNNDIFNSMAEYIEVISIEGYPTEIYSYTITQESYDIYLITFNFKRDILDNPLVTIFINIPSEILKQGEIEIPNQILKINLMKNFCLNEEEQETVEQIGLTTQVGTSAVAGLAVMSSFTGSTSCFRMSMILGLIELLKYQKINYTPVILKIFDQQSEFPPEFINSLKMQFKEDNQKDLESIPENFGKYDVSPYVLNNLIQKMFIILIGILIGFGLFALNKLLKKYKKSQKKMIKSLMSLWGWLYQWIVWNLIYFILIDAFLEIVFYSLVEISCTPVNSIKGKVNLFFGVLFILFALFLIYHFYLKIESLSKIQSELKDVKSEANSPALPKITKQQLTPYNSGTNIPQKLWFKFQRMLKYWYQPNFNSIEDKKQYLSDHEILFNDYKPDANLTYNFILFELGRLFAISAVIALLKEYPLLQTILNLLILVFFVIVIFIIKPYKKRLMAILSVCIELCLISAYMGAFLFAQYDQNGDINSKNPYNNIEKFVIYGVLGITFISIVQMIINAFDFIKLLIEKFKQYQQKKRRESGELFQIKQKKITKFQPLNIEQKPVEINEDSPNENLEKPEKENLQQIIIDK